MQGKDSTDKITAYVGIDVCKAWLDVHIAAEGRSIALRVANSAKGIGELKRRLAGFAVRRVALEATGRLHLAVWAALAETGLAVMVLNPYRARKFADALGRLAKTDAIDARVLALAAERLEVAPSEPLSPSRLRLKELQTLRRGLVARRVALANQLGGAADAFARRLLAAEKALIERHLAKLDAELQSCVAADPALARLHAILVSIPGLGSISAILLIAELPELGRATDKEIAALVGVAPMNWDTGASRGRRRIKGGAPSGPSGGGCAPPASPTGWSSPRCCESSSSSPTLSSRTTVSGPRNRLDRNTDGFVNAVRRSGAPGPRAVSYGIRPFRAMPFRLANATEQFRPA